MGGSITGEHGVGMEKDRLMPLLFTEAELDVMRRVRDVFNPQGLLNPEKIFPSKKAAAKSTSARCRWPARSAHLAHQVYKTR